MKLVKYALIAGFMAATPVQANDLLFRIQTEILGQETPVKV